MLRCTDILSVRRTFFGFCARGCRDDGRLRPVHGRRAAILLASRRNHGAQAQLAFDDMRHHTAPSHAWPCTDVSAGHFGGPHVQLEPRMQPHNVAPLS